MKLKNVCISKFEGDSLNLTTVINVQANPEPNTVNWCVHDLTWSVT